MRELGKIPFTMENAKKCICWKCPVHTKSKCIEENATKMGEVMTTEFFDPKIVPGLYCSSGKATCADIQTELPCICGACPIFTEFRLAEGVPADHYCKNGHAK
ncbi:MAG: DUF2769 domain-containing protein [Desulfobacterales bacterium]|nr:DUF2769 domain-containing protein [Desulfobacterales bacterium]